MIVSVSIGEDVEVTVDDDMAGCYSPTRATELCAHALTVLSGTLAACKASTSRTVRAKQQ